MEKGAEKTLEHIKHLVDQYFATSSSGLPTKKRSVNNESKAKKGCSGAISILIEEGFFNAPKDLGAVIERLKEIGRYYPKPTISMNLLNLTKRRLFNRIKENKGKKWQYVLRR